MAPFSVELRGLEPLTPTLPVWCATSCAIAPYFTITSATHFSGALRLLERSYTMADDAHKSRGQGGQEWSLRNDPGGRSGACGMTRVAGVGRLNLWV